MRLFGWLIIKASLYEKYALDTDECIHAQNREIMDLQHKCEELESKLATVSKRNRPRRGMRR